MVNNHDIDLIMIKFNIQEDERVDNLFDVGS